MERNYENEHVTLIDKFKNLSIADRDIFHRQNLNDWYNFKAWLRVLSGDLWISTDIDNYIESYKFIDDISIDRFIIKYKDNIVINTMYDDVYNIYYINEDFAFNIQKSRVTITLTGLIKNLDAKDKLKEFVKAHFKENKLASEYKIGLLSYNPRDGYNILNNTIKPRLDLNLEDNYNDGFSDVHDRLIDNIKRNSKSMHILHGLPGTGKTTYLKYLLSVLAKDNLDVVYLPPNVAHLLASPDFIADANLFKNKIVFIEDAEEILVDKGTRSQAINNILNIADGILSDIFNVHFIFTFNVGVNKIDPALLRKGRLNFKYEFKELAEDKVKNLCTKLGIDCSDSKTLAEIYNKEGNIINTEPTKKLGFNVN